MNAPVQTPLLSIAIVPKTPDDRQKLGRGLAWLMSEDPTIAIKGDTVSGELHQAHALGIRQTSAKPLQ